MDGEIDPKRYRPTQTGVVTGDSTWYPEIITSTKAIVERAAVDFKEAVRGEIPHVPLQHANSNMVSVQLER